MFLFMPDLGVCFFFVVTVFWNNMPIWYLKGLSHRMWQVQSCTLKPICFYCLRHSITVLKSKCAGESTLACQGQHSAGLNLVNLWPLRRTFARPIETKPTALLSSTTQWMKIWRKSWLCVFPISTNFMTQVYMHTETLGGNNTLFTSVH